MKILDQKNFAAGLLYLTFGGAVAIWSLNYQLGTAMRMGPGYFPFGVGLALVLTGPVVLLGSVSSGVTRSRLGPWGLKAVLFISAGVVAFGLLIKPFGLIVAVPALIGISAFADAHRSWRTLLIAIGVLLPLAWLIFVVLLGLQLRLFPAFMGP